MTGAWPMAGVAVLIGLLGVAGLVAWNLRLFRLAPAPLANGPGVSVLIPAREAGYG